MGCSCISSAEGKLEKEKDMYLLVYVKEPGFLDREWYVIKQTTRGAEISQASEIPRPYRCKCVLPNSFELVGSSIYVIGGHYLQSFSSVQSAEFITDDSNYDERDMAAVRVLNTCKPNEGWETLLSLPGEYIPGLTSVCGSWIYVQGAQYFPSGKWGYVFNVDTKEGYPLERPCPGTCPLVSVALGDRLLFRMNGSCTLYVHDPSSRTWQTFGEDKSGRCTLSCNYAISDGILYFYNSDSLILNAYDIEQKSYLPPISFEDSVWFGKYHNVKLVSLGSGKLCLIYSVNFSKSLKSSVYYTKFSVCRCAHEPRTFVLEQKKIEADFIFLIDCQALDASLDGIEGGGTLRKSSSRCKTLSGASQRRREKRERKD